MAITLIELRIALNIDFNLIIGSLNLQIFHRTVLSALLDL
jgi:hypothetical protein